MNFEQAPEFQKELKKLTKKWRSLPRDIKSVERDLVPLYVAQKDVDITRLRETFFDSKKAAILHKTETREVVKMRLDVADLGRSDKARVIFIAVKTENTITFIELYAKNEKSREDKSRIRKYM